MAKSPTPSPTVLRWELASRLRSLRVAAGRSVDDAATELMCSAAKISRLETGGRGIQARDVRDLCRYYGVTDQERDALIKLAQEARRPGWWQDYRSLDEQTATFIGLESAASGIRMMEGRVLPGLLQTDDYSRTLLRGILVPQATDDQISEIVEIRRHRRQRLETGSLELSVVIDEAAVARDFGQSAMMLQQIEQLIEDSHMSNVTIRAVLFNSDPYPGIEGSFHYLEFKDRAVSDLIFVEGLLGKFIVDREAEVQRYLTAFDMTLEKALTPVQTRDWLAEKREAILARPGGI